MPHRQTYSKGGTAIRVRRGIATLNARSGPDPHGGYCHSNHVCQQTDENPCVFHFSFLLNDHGGPGRVSRRRVAGPVVW